MIHFWIVIHFWIMIHLWILFPFGILIHFWILIHFRILKFKQRLFSKEKLSRQKSTLESPSAISHIMARKFEYLKLQTKFMPRFKWDILGGIFKLDTKRKEISGKSFVFCLLPFDTSQSNVRKRFLTFLLSFLITLPFLQKLHLLSYKEKKETHSV